VHFAKRIKKPGYFAHYFKHKAPVKCATCTIFRGFMASIFQKLFLKIIFYLIFYNSV